MVRSPYPISDQCFPVPECEHKCEIVKEHVCDIKQKKKCGVINEKACKIVYETECSSFTEKDCTIVNDRECTTGGQFSHNLHTKIAFVFGNDFQIILV